MSEKSESAEHHEARSFTTTASTTTAVAGASPLAEGAANRNPARLRPGVAAKELLEADDAEHRYEPEPPPYSVLGRLRRYGGPALHYLLQTEVHTYAFSFAANALLSFFPFIVLLLTLTRRVFHSMDMYNVVIELLHQ